MNMYAKRASLLGIIGNAGLFILKVIAGFIYNSLAVISDAFNSLTDIVASVIVYISIKTGAMVADEDHPFGHHRAEPIASLIVAIFTGILGFQVIVAAIKRMIMGAEIVRGIAPMIVLTLTIIIKLFMYFYTIKAGKRAKSTALIASAIDHRNDVLISSGAFIGVAGTYFLGYMWLDALVALPIGFWIIKAGYDIGIGNIKFLMGESPPKEMLSTIKKKALSVSGVCGVHDVRAHYVGVLLQVEVHINVDDKLTLHKAHEIGNNVKREIKSIENVTECFVHIDTMKKD